MNNIVTFDNHQLRVIENQNRKWFCARDIAKALEFRNPDADVCNIYRRNKSEFADDMTCTCKLQVQGQNKTVRLYNREGAWLIGMFARTPKAVEFRKWVLKVLGAVADTPKAGVEVAVREHTRSLPTGKKEIVLSDKAKTEIGGIVKSCLGAVLDSRNSMDTIFDNREVVNKFAGLVTSVNFLMRHDELMREADELRYQAKMREKQAKAYMNAVDKLESVA